MKRAIGVLGLTAVMLGGMAHGSRVEASSCAALASDLARSVDHFTTGRRVSNAIYVEHPQFKRGLLGCASRTRANDIFAESADRKPRDEFYNAVAQAGGIIFSVPMKDVKNGALRCARMSARRLGREVNTRYRRMTFVCAMRKDGMRMTVSRERE